MLDITKLLRNAERLEKNSHEQKDKVQKPRRNEMLSLYCTKLGFISKNEEYNPK